MKKEKSPPRPAPGDGLRGACDRLAARPGLACALFVVLSFAVYTSAIPNEFVFDDHSTFRKNPLVAQPSRVLEILDPSESSHNNYRPVRYLSFVLDYAIGGDNPWIYHVFNSIYHGITCFLVFCLLVRLSRDPRAALAGALLFAVHPAHTECVAYISGRRDILTTLFYLAAFLAFLRLWDMFGEADTPRPVLRIAGWGAAAAALFALALGSKEMAVTFPAMVILYLALFEAKAIRARLTPRVAAALVLTLLVLGLLAGLAVWRAFATNIPGRQGPWGGSWSVHSMTAACLVANYLRLCLFPATLLADYSIDAFPLARSLFELRTLASIAALLACAAVALRLFRKSPKITFGIAWFFLALAPVAQIVPYHELGADHYVYLPSVGLCLLAGLGLASAWDRWGRRAALRALAAVLVAFLVRTEVRIPDWRSPETLYRATLATAPRCARAHLNLGALLARRKTGSRDQRLANLKEAESHFNSAVECDPDRIYAWVCRAQARDTLGRTAEAKADFEKALELARASARPGLPMVDILFPLKRYREAAEILEPMAREGRAGVKDLTRLAKCREMLGNPAGAVETLKQACELAPDDEDLLATGLRLSMKSRGRDTDWFYDRLKARNPSLAQKVLLGQLPAKPEEDPSADR